MSDVIINETVLYKIGSAIRQRLNTSSTYTLSEMANIIRLMTPVTHILEGNITSYHNSNISSIPDCTFQYCSKLSFVNTPACYSIGNYAFAGCSSLISANIPVCNSIGEYAFQNCTKLVSVYLNYVSSVTYLANSYVFSGCSSLANIYVPTSLFESFKTAVNWSYYSDKFISI